MTDAQALVHAARQLLGVRFAHQGRSVHGLDCLGLLLLAAQQAGITLQNKAVMHFDRRDYGTWPDTQYLQATLEAHLAPAEDELRCGDVLLLRIEGRPQHLALVTDYPAPASWGMIHAYAAARKVVEHRLDAAWEQAIHRRYRLP